MMLELGLIGLLTVSQPNLLNEKPPDIVRPFLNAEIEQVFVNYESDLTTKLETLTFKMDAGYKVNYSFSIGYETRKFDVSGYGNSGDYVFIKISYIFEK